MTPSADSDDCIGTKEQLAKKPESGSAATHRLPATCVLTLSHKCAVVLVVGFAAAGTEGAWQGAAAELGSEGAAADDDDMATRSCDTRRL